MHDVRTELTHNSRQEEETCSCCAVYLFEERPPFWKRRKLITGGIAGVLLISGLILEFLAFPKIVVQLIFLSVIAVAGREILKKAWSSILEVRLDMNCLMSLAAFGAFFIGHGEEGAAIIFLFFAAETLEEYAADNATKSISKLLTLAPETANVRRDGKEVILHTHEIVIGDTVIIRPGEKVPLDGEIVTGHSSVDESPITGESVPAEKEEGDRVYAGTLNEEGYLEVRVGKTSGDSVLSKIVKLVDEAEKKKSKTERFIDKFARIYTPTVIALALATFLIPTFVLGYSWDIWFYRALVLLVVSCPCALAISTPVAMVSAITSAARQGVLIKGATYIEELSRIRAIAFDKTGTLTKGKLEVTDIMGLNHHSPEEVLSIAASMEARSAHPIAKAILQRAKDEKIRLKKIDTFTSIKGKGLKADIEGKTYFAGAPNLFDFYSVRLPAGIESCRNEMSRFEAEGKTSIFLSNEDRVIGVIALGDRIREKTPSIISHLKNWNIRTEMLTGDNKKVADTLAARIGIDEYHAQLLPEDKVNVIHNLSAKFGSVAMVGDGVNDAPALAAANVGIAMGTVGSDVAIETADIALMHDDLSKLDYLIYLSRKSMNVVKENITVSILVKASFTVMALLGLINLWVAVAVGDMGLSLTVIMNAMRLTRLRA